MHPSLWTALLLASIGSCDPAQFKHPLSDPAKIKAEPKLTGQWAGHDERTQFTMFIGPREDQHLDLLLVGTSPGEGVAQIAWDAFPTTLGGKTYLNLREKEYADTFGNRFTLKPGYAYIRYELKGETLKLAYLTSDATEGDGGVPVAGETEAVAAAVQKLPVGAFKPFITMKRVKGQ